MAVCQISGITRRATFEHINYVEIREHVCACARVVDTANMCASTNVQSLTHNERSNAGSSSGGGAREQRWPGFPLGHTLLEQLRNGGPDSANAQSVASECMYVCV